MTTQETTQEVTISDTSGPPAPTKYGATERKEHPTRLDKWLWATRFFKTRAVAIQAVKAGRVRLKKPDEDDKPAHPNNEIKSGDIITIKFGKGKNGKEIKVKVIGLCTRRRNIEDASELYEEQISDTPRKDYKAQHGSKFKRPYKVSDANQTRRTPKSAHTQQQFPSDMAQEHYKQHQEQHFIDRAQRWYDNPDSEDKDGNC